MSNTRLVYSTDPKDNVRCETCKELLKECTCESEKEFSHTKFTAVFRIEKNGRGGKTVTVIDQLPKQEPFLKQLTGDLKKMCGSGGKYEMTGREGKIEIQGDKRDQIKKHFDKIGIKYKGM